MCRESLDWMRTQDDNSTRESVRPTPSRSTPSPHPYARPAADSSPRRQASPSPSENGTCPISSSHLPVKNGDMLRAKGSTLTPLATPAVQGPVPASQTTMPPTEWSWTTWSPPPEYHTSGQATSGDSTFMPHRTPVGPLPPSMPHVTRIPFRPQIATPPTMIDFGVDRPPRSGRMPFMAIIDAGPDGPEASTTRNAPSPLHTVRRRMFDIYDDMTNGQLHSSPMPMDGLPPPPAGSSSGQGARGDQFRHEATLNQSYARGRQSSEPAQPPLASGSAARQPSTDDRRDVPNRHPEADSTFAASRMDRRTSPPPIAPNVRDSSRWGNYTFGYIGPEQMNRTTTTATPPTPVRPVPWRPALWDATTPTSPTPVAPPTERKSLKAHITAKERELGLICASPECLHDRDSTPSEAEHRMVVHDLVSLKTPLSSPDPSTEKGVTKKACPHKWHRDCLENCQPPRGVEDEIRMFVVCGACKARAWIMDKEETMSEGEVEKLVQCS